MEKGDVYGLVGMILGIEACTSVVTSFLYLPMMSIPMLMAMMLAIVYISVLGGGTVAIILSIIGIAKNTSKFGIVGLIFSSLSMVLFVFLFLLV